MQIFVIDGGSLDNTAQEVKNLCNKHSEIELLLNPKKIVPVAMNIGVNSASHSIILWLGAHAIYDEDYITNSVQILISEKSASVGGVISPRGKTTVGKAIAAATTSKFGIGNAKYRHATRRQKVDTVFGGCWLKTNIEAIGGFNEAWVRNQDYEFNCRLREKVGPIILDPNIQCKYYCRETIQSLGKQYFQYGFGRFNTLVLHPNSFTLRQSAPVTLFLGLIASFVMYILNIGYPTILPIIYLTAIVLVTLKLTVIKRKPSFLLWLPLIFPTIHLSWACGFIGNAFKHLYKNKPGQKKSVNIEL